MRVHTFKTDDYGQVELYFFVSFCYPFRYCGAVDYASENIDQNTLNLISKWIKENQ